MLTLTFTESAGHILTEVQNKLINLQETLICEKCFCRAYENMSNYRFIRVLNA